MIRTRRHEWNKSEYLKQTKNSNEVVLAVVLLPAAHPLRNCCPEEGFPKTRGTWRGAGFALKRLQNSWKLIASLHHTSRDSVKNMKLYFAFCSQILVIQVQGGLVCTSLPGLEPGLSDNLYFACTCGVQGTKATFSLARWLHKESWLVYNSWFLGLRTGLIHQSSHDDWSENNFFVDVLFPNNYGFVVMWMVSILYNVIDHDLSNKVVVFRDCWAVHLAMIILMKSLKNIDRSISKKVVDFRDCWALHLTMDQMQLSTMDSRYFRWEHNNKEWGLFYGSVCIRCFYFLSMTAIILQLQTRHPVPRDQCGEYVSGWLDKNRSITTSFVQKC